MSRIYLSPPHMGGDEEGLVRETFESNWIAPLGPQVDAFEREFAEAVGVAHAAALSSGTAALHLALLMLGVGPDDDVLCPTLTFGASAFAITYVGARPLFLDCSSSTWNLDPAVLVEALEEADSEGGLPAALVAVDLYGQSVDWEPVLESCERFGVPVIEDAAEALGATYRGKAVGGFGRCGIFSFNGNKIITTSGGGMLVSEDAELIEKARFLATQARDPAPHYQHSEIGYNYRMSSILAAIGRGQLRVLEDRVAARRENFEHYQSGLSGLPGLEFMPEAPWGRCTRWLTCMTIDPEVFGATQGDVRLALEEEDIEARPVWKPMHLQPVFSDCRVYGGSVAEKLFDKGLCLPSGSNLGDRDRDRVIRVIQGVCRAL
jgi:dTDP-4-amino-4,6-dideoxygalactose transaminase